MRKNKVDKRQVETAIDEILCELRATGIASNINCGGCGVFAKLLALKLSSVGVPCQIVFFDEEEPAEVKKEFLNNARNSNKTKFNRRERLILTPEHVAVRIKGTKLIVDGARTSNKNPDGHYSMDELEFALKYGTWNPAYDKRQNPKVARVIESGFERAGFVNCQLKLFR